MADANEPRLMKARGNSADEREFDHVTGDAGRDGFTRIARREVRGRPTGENYPWGEPRLGSDEITPQVGQTDYSRGPRYSED